MFRATVVIVALLSAASAWAQSNFGKRYAVLVAVDKYPDESKLKALKCQERDSILLKSTLELVGYRDRVSLLTESNQATIPEKDNILTELKRVAKVCQPADTLLVALSGHGLTLDATPGESYYCPKNCRLNSNGDGYDPESLISKAEVNEIFQACKARVKILIINACNNLPTGLGEQNAPALGFPGNYEFRFSSEKSSLPKGTVIIHGCEPGKFSFEDPDGENFHDPGELGHTLLLYYFQQGIRVNAERHNERNRSRIKLDQVWSFLETEVRDHSTKHAGGDDLVQVPYREIVGQSAEQKFPNIDFADCYEYETVTQVDLHRNSKGKRFERKKFIGKFDGPLFLNDATFSDCIFERCTFGKGVYVHGATFRDCTFSNSKLFQAKGANQVRDRGYREHDDDRGGLGSSAE